MMTKTNLAVLVAVALFAGALGEQRNLRLGLQDSLVSGGGYNCNTEDYLMEAIKGCKGTVENNVAKIVEGIPGGSGVHSTSIIPMAASPSW